MAEMRIAEPLKPLASVIYLKSIMQAFAGHVLPDIKKKNYFGAFNRDIVFSYK
jgi:hypothetical protein